MSETQNQNNGHTAPLTAAPTDAEPPKPATPTNYVVEFLVETNEGFHAAVTGVGLTPRDALIWLKSASKQLAEQGFKPVRRDLVVTMPQASAAPAAAAASGGAVWIKGEDGKPPRCSLHGAGVWKEGVIGAGKPRAGEAYAFWACSNRNCRPKGEAT